MRILFWLILLTHLQPHRQGRHQNKGIFSLYRSTWVLLQIGTQLFFGMPNQKFFKTLP
jgi:hypothetical protein